MTDSLTNTLIGTFGSIIIALLGLIKRNVDGNLRRMEDKFDAATKTILNVSTDASHAQGMKDQKDSAEL